MQLHVVLNDVCRRKGLSFEQLAAKSGCSYGCIMDLLRGATQSPKYSNMVKICSALEITLDELEMLRNLDENAYMDKLYRMRPCVPD